LGADHVLDYHDEDWPNQVLALTGGAGVACAANAARGGAPQAMQAVADGGRLATITSDPPASVRGISVSNVYVRPDGNQLRSLARQLTTGRLDIRVAAAYPLDQAARALAVAMHGAGGGGGVVLTRHP
jgi:NADPH:quinone reductase-like Zn-dependent oxidoreductase